MRNLVAPVSNVLRLSSAYQELKETPAIHPRMSLVWGSVGNGKTVATTKLSIDATAVHVICESVWTPTALLNAMLREVGKAPERSASEGMNALKEALQVNPRMIVVDECDHIYGKRAVVECLRSLHDKCAVPVMLIGEEASPQKLQRYPQLYSRISHFIKFEALTLDDLSVLAEKCCEVKIDLPLLKKLLDATDGNTRQCSVALRRIEAVTQGQCADLATLELWGDLPFASQGVRNA